MGTKNQGSKFFGIIMAGCWNRRVSGRRTGRENEELQDQENFAVAMKLRKFSC